MRTAIFIDGANLYTSLSHIQKRINFQNLQANFTSAMPAQIRYYTATKKDNHTGLNALQKFTDWMRYNGIQVVEKDAKQMVNDAGALITKGNMDIELAVDALILASTIDCYVFFTGDGDFTYLFKELRRRGKHITLISTAPAKQPIAQNANVVADILRRECDKFMNMNDTQDFSQRFLDDMKSMGPQDEIFL